MARFILTINNASGALVNGISPAPPGWIATLTTPILPGAFGTVDIDVPNPAPGGHPVTAIVQYSQAAGGIWRLLMTNPGPGPVAPNANGAYVPPPAPPPAHAVAIALGPCPVGAPAGAICYNVTFT
jgi:hypothetical protein